MVISMKDGFTSVFSLFFLKHLELSLGVLTLDICLFLYVRQNLFCFLSAGTTCVSIMFLKRIKRSMSPAHAYLASLTTI